MMRYAILVIAMAVAIGCSKKAEPTDAPAPSSDKPSAKGIPEDWTHSELLAHLNKKGAKWRMIPTGRGSFFGPTNYLVSADSNIKDEKTADAAIEAKSKEIAICQIRKTAQEAKDEMGAIGERGFANGRFCFNGSPEMLARIRVSLP